MVGASMNNKRSNLQIIFKLIKLISGLKFKMFLAIFFGFLGHVCALFIPVLGAVGILKALKFEMFFSYVEISVLLLLLAVLRGIFRYIEQNFNHYIAFSILAIMRDKIFMALRKLAPAKLQGSKSGDLISLITTDVELLEVFYAHTISPIAIAIIFMVFMLLFLAWFNWTYAVIAFISYLCIGLILPYFSAKRSGDDGLKFRNKAGSLSSYLLDSLRGLDEVNQYKAGSTRLKGIADLTNQMLDVDYMMKKRKGSLIAKTTTLIIVFDLVFLLVARQNVLNNPEISYFNSLLPIVAFFSSFGPFIALSNLASTLENTFASGSRILDILEDKPVTLEILDKNDVVFNEVKLSDVDFSYDEKKVLAGVNFEVSKDSIVGIKGKSGSGKSTILKLIMRFWDVNTGTVMISDSDVKQINTKSLRNIEDYIMQDTYLFNESIADNIRIAKLDATDEEIVSACKKASVHEFISSLANGYDTVVGELGSRLSAGERQRIGLARVFLRNTDLLLLDEPTSNLDSLNQAVILKSIHKERKDRAVIIVSHRDSSLKICDRVVTINEINKLKEN